jgi:hypothetical protein
VSNAVAVRRGATDSPAPSRADFRALLERVLADVDADEKVGALLRAADIRVRFRFPDLDMTLNVAASDEPGHHLRWAFSNDGDWVPRLELEMASEVANRYLQGKESLAVAIARGRVKVRGESRIALLYVPTIRLVCDPYRRVVASDFPHLAIA